MLQGRIPVPGETMVRGARHAGFTCTMSGRAPNYWELKLSPPTNLKLQYYSDSTFEMHIRSLMVDVWNMASQVLKR